MIEIIQHRGWDEAQRHWLDFGCQKDVNFSFLVDFAGRHITFDGRGVPQTYWKCIRGEFPGLVCHGIRTETRHVKWPAIGRCPCGEEVCLDSFTCECPGCGALYNFAGQELCEPRLWGDETGESPADILRIK